MTSRNEYYKNYHKEKQETDEYYRELKKFNSRKQYINRKKSQDEIEWDLFVEKQRNIYLYEIVPALYNSEYYKNKVKNTIK